MTTPAPPSPSGGRTVTIAPETALSSSQNLLAGLIGISFGAIWLGVIASAFVGGRGLLLAVVLLVVGVGATTGRRLVTKLRWHDAELVLPSSALELGGTTWATYRRVPRRSVDLTGASITWTLRCREKAVIRRGKNSRTDYQTVHQASGTVAGEGPSDRFEAPIRLEIPLHRGGPSLAVTNHGIEWILTVERATGNLAGSPDRFPIRVVARIDDSLPWASARR